jgi:hypothetical protein
MRPVIHTGDQRRFEQLALFARRKLAAQHQPDHFRKANASDQLLDRIPAYRDLPRVNIDDGGVPPRARISDQLVGCLRCHGRSRIVPHNISMSTGRRE